MCAPTGLLPASVRTHLRCGFLWEESPAVTVGRRYTMVYRSPQGDRSTGTGASSSKVSGVTRQS